MCTRSLVGMVLVGWMSITGYPAAPSASGQDAATVARSLVPLLKDVRQRVTPHVTVEPAPLPPSPFTGRSSTLVGVRVGWDGGEVDEAVLQAMDGLLRWDREEPLSAAHRELVARWLDELQVKMLAHLASAGLPVACDDVCVVQRLTHPDTTFGANARERQERRDELLLAAFIAAVEDAPPGR